MAVQKKLIAIRLKPSTIDKLKQYADEKEESVSEYVRKILESYIQAR